jgi:hypothetical protein
MGMCPVGKCALVWTWTSEAVFKRREQHSVIQGFHTVKLSHSIPYYTKHITLQTQCECGITPFSSWKRGTHPKRPSPPGEGHVPASTEFPSVALWCTYVQPVATAGLAQTAQVHHTDSCGSSNWRFDMILSNKYTACKNIEGRGHTKHTTHLRSCIWCTYWANQWKSRCYHCQWAIDHVSIVFVSRRRAIWWALSALEQSKTLCYLPSRPSDPTYIFIFVFL